MLGRSVADTKRRYSLQRSGHRGTKKRAGSRVEGGLLSLKKPRDKRDFGDGLDARDVFDSFPASRSKKDGRRHKIVAPVLVVCALVAVLVLVDYWSNVGRIYPGVEVGTVPLGDKTREEARQVVEDQLTGTLK